MNFPDQPTRPTHIPDFAEVCLQALAIQGLGDKISLGGAFGLLHYLDYRSTNDVDAWWQLATTTQEKQQVITALEAVLREYGNVSRRTFGDVVSVELATTQRRKAFSFQIAERSVQLEPSIAAQWTPVLLDSFADLVASKMVALVQRGAPRDFRDIHAICLAGLVTQTQCWQLWQQRQQLTNDDHDWERAKLAISGHLERIEQYRPLATIHDTTQRSQAEAVRQWYRKEFLHENVD